MTPGDRAVVCEFYWWAILHADFVPGLSWTAQQILDANRIAEIFADKPIFKLAKDEFASLVEMIIWDQGVSA